MAEKPSDSRLVAEKPSDPKALAAESQRLKERIKKRIQLDQIEGNNLWYSILKKKNNSKIGSNERLVLLKRLEYFGYASKLEDKVLIPFKSHDQVPIPKVKIPLNLLLKVQVEKEQLYVTFNENAKEVKWEFVCISNKTAKQWAGLINGARDEFKLKAINQPINVEIGGEKGGEKEPEKNAEQTQIKPPEEKINGSQARLEREKSIGDKPEREKLPPPELNPSLEKSPIKVISQPEKQIPSPSKPISTKFVGGSSLELNTLESLTPNERSREQYRIKKREEELLKLEMESENISEPIMDPTLELQKLRLEWSYQFAKGMNEFEIVARFGTYVELLARRVIDELGLEERQRYYRPVQERTYQIENVRLQLFCNELVEYQDRSTLVAANKIKEMQQEMKNYNYILTLTRNKGKIRVPLMMVVEYKGFVISAKAKIQESTNFEGVQALQRELDALESESKIQNSLFQDPDNGKIVPANIKLYQKLARGESLNRKYDICYLQDLRHYLPHDFAQFSKDRPYERLRGQLIKDLDGSKRYSGENMLNIVNRLKMPIEVKEAVNVLTEVSKSIGDRINELLVSLEDIDAYFCNSEELSELMHQSGVNTRYLGIMYERCKEDWLKHILGAEIAARCSKYYFKFDLQDNTLALNLDSADKVKAFQGKYVVQYLNKLLGNSRESDTLWRTISKHAVVYFKCNINKEYINKGYFLQSLQKQLGIKLKWAEGIFKSSNVIDSSHFQGFTVKSKVYDLEFTELYSNVNHCLNNLTFESYEELNTLLNLKKKDEIPHHFHFDRTDQRIMLFVANWRSAKDLLFKRYNLNAGSSKALYQLKMTQIKWLLKSKDQREAEEVRDEIVEHVGRWLGEAHPVLNELYDIFSHYYIDFKEEEKKAVNYSKSSIKNTEKLLGGLHIKLADSYYNLGNVYVVYSRKGDALNSYGKARQIMASNDSQETEAYGLICMKMGQLYLALNSVQEAIECAGTACKVGGQDSYLQSVELLGRCYEVNEQWGEYIDFVQNQVVGRIADYLGEADKLDRVIKVLLMPLLHEIASKSKMICSRILTVISQLPKINRAVTGAYTYLKSCVDENVFPLLFMDCLRDIERVLDQLETNGTLNRWKGFEQVSRKKNQSTLFVAVLEALNVFLSGNFIEGIFREV